jgi:hypothetical protein
VSRLKGKYNGSHDTTEHYEFLSTKFFGHIWNGQLLALKTNKRNASKVTPFIVVPSCRCGKRGAVKPRRVEHLCNDLPDHLPTYIRQPERPSLEIIRESLVIKTQLVQDRCLDIVWRHSSLDAVISDFIRLAI